MRLGPVILGLALLASQALAEPRCPRSQNFGDGRQGVWCWDADTLVVGIGKQMPEVMPQDWDVMRRALRPGKCMTPFERMAQASLDWIWYFCGIQSRRSIVSISGMPVLLLEGGDAVRAAEWLVPLDGGMCRVQKMPGTFDGSLVSSEGDETTRCASFVAFPRYSSLGRKWKATDVVALSIEPPPGEKAEAIGAQVTP